MDDSSIAGRTENLRREIALIQQEERSYLGQGTRSPLDRAEHAEREGRVRAIRDELKTLVEKVKQQLSHGLVWYR
jgi:hypothetical protein